MPNKWILFVKKWAAKKGLSYGCALSQPQLKIDYRKAYPTKQQQSFREAVERGGMEDEDKNVGVVPKRKKVLTVTEAERKIHPAIRFGLKEGDIVRLNKNKSVYEKGDLFRVSEIIYNAEDARPDTAFNMHYDNSIVLLHEGDLSVMRIVSWTPTSLFTKMPKGTKFDDGVEEPKSAAEKVLTNPTLLKYIQEFNKPKISKKQIDSFAENIKNINYLSGVVLTAIYPKLVKYKTKKQKEIVGEKAFKISGVIDEMVDLLVEQLEFLANEKVEKDKLYYNKKMSYEDYGTRLGIGSDLTADKNTAERIDEIMEYAFDNFKNIMEKMGVPEKDAVNILNKRLENK